MVSDAEGGDVGPVFESQRKDVCKCIVPSRCGGTPNNLRAASPLVKLVDRNERWEAPDHPQNVLSLKIGVEPNKIELSRHA
ncbi:hypothetical protein TNCV_3021741 [Trichonephila clavipes]|nr:hypothetical protein TNCV_3021741 [Trichonephila clavipes]